MVAFPWPQPAAVAAADLAARIVEEGFVRAIVDGQTVELANLAAQAAAAESKAALPLFAESADEAATDVEADTQEQESEESEPKEMPEGAAADWHVIVDRLTAGGAADERLRDSLETAFEKGRGRVVLYIDESAAAAADLGGATVEIDGRAWRRVKRNTRLMCDDCGSRISAAEPRLFSFNSPLGACPECEGFGNVVDIDMELVVPDEQKSIREGAIAPWNTPAYAHEREELLALAEGLRAAGRCALRRADRRAAAVDRRRRARARSSAACAASSPGSNGANTRCTCACFLSRWRSYRPCPACGGARLRPEALAVRVGGKNIAEISAMPVDEAEPFVRAA